MLHSPPHPSRVSRRLRHCAIAAIVAFAPVVAAAQNMEEATEPAPRDRRPFSAFSATAMSMRDSIVTVARSQIGTRYKYGGTTPSGGFDCSGFVRYVLNAIQLVLPRTAAQQAEYGATIPKDTTASTWRPAHVRPQWQSHAHRDLRWERTLCARQPDRGTGDRNVAGTDGVAAGENLARRPAAPGRARLVVRYHCGGALGRPSPPNVDDCRRTLEPATVHGRRLVSFRIVRFWDETSHIWARTARAPLEAAS